MVTERYRRAVPVLKKDYDIIRAGDMKRQEQTTHALRMMQWARHQVIQKKENYQGHQRLLHNDKRFKPL